MTQAELFAQLKTVGLPIAYSHFEDPTEPPFMCYRFTFAEDFKADNQNYAKISNFDIELYAKVKDLASEGLIESLLDSLRLPFAKAETYIGSEKLLQVIYEIQLVGG